MQEYYVYILECSDKSYYTGFTTDLQYRIGQHQAGTIPCYTRSRRPVTLRWYEVFGNRGEALAAERQIKGWTRAKKEALIAGDFKRLKELSHSSLQRNSRKSG